MTLIGKRILRAAIGCVVFLAPHLANAEPLQLGASYSLVQASFTATATAVGEAGGPRMLEVNDAQFAGMKWGKVDFTFDRSARLSSVSLTTTQVSFAQVQELMAAQLEASTSGMQDISQDPEGDVQIRICEKDNSEVTVTFERTPI